jgi:hypothetical protein
MKTLMILITLVILLSTSTYSKPKTVCNPKPTKIQEAYSHLKELDQKLRDQTLAPWTWNHGKLREPVLHISTVP